MTEMKGNKNILKDLVSKVGLATIIIGAFWILTLIVAVTLDMSLPTLITDTLKRAGMNGILVLAMVPSIQSGTGPNFALPVGIVCGLLGIVVSIELGFTGISWLFMSVLLSVPLAILAGYLYGKLLNAVKGSEMTIATYTGFSIVAFMCLIWLMVPFKSPKMGWFIGTGLRETIQLGGVGGAQILNNLLKFEIGGIVVPTGLLLVFLFFCLLMWLFSKSKTGLAITAGGMSPKFSTATGLNNNRNRIIANIVSTVLAAIGIIIYSQSYGFVQLYNGPLLMAFSAVAAILIGGATASRAKVSNVIVGVIIFQGLLTVALPVANSLLAGTDLSEVLRMIIQNGIILYALTQVKGGNK